MHKAQLDAMMNETRQRGLSMKTVPQVGDVVKVTYFGVVTEVRGEPKFEPHFELDNNPTRHVVAEVSEMVIYGDDAPATALARSFDRVDRDF